MGAGPRGCGLLGGATDSVMSPPTENLKKNRKCSCSYSCSKITKCRFITGIRTTAVSVCFCKIDCKGVAALNRSLLRESLHGPRPSAAARPPRPPPASIHTSFPCPHLPRPQTRPGRICFDPPSPIVPGWWLRPSAESAILHVCACTHLFEERETVIYLASQQCVVPQSANAQLLPPHQQSRPPSPSSVSCSVALMSVMKHRYLPLVPCSYGRSKPAIGSCKPSSARSVPHLSFASLPHKAAHWAPFLGPNFGIVCSPAADCA